MLTPRVLWLQKECLLSALSSEEPFLLWGKLSEGRRGGATNVALVETTLPSQGHVERVIGPPHSSSWLLSMVSFEKLLSVCLNIMCHLQLFAHSSLFVLCCLAISLLYFLFSFWVCWICHFPRRVVTMCYPSYLLWDWVLKCVFRACLPQFIMGRSVISLCGAEVPAALRCPAPGHRSRADPQAARQVLLMVWAGSIPSFSVLNKTVGIIHFLKAW